MNYLILVLLMFSSSVLAAPVVIEETGQTEAMTTYYQPLDQETLQTMQQTMNEQASAEVEAMMNSHLKPISTFPVQTPELTTGTIVPHKNNSVGMTQPIFIINDDETCQSWLSDHAEQLLDMHVLGFVANVDTEAHLKSLQQSAPQLTLTALPMNDIAEELHLTSVPVVITPTEIFQ